MNGAQQIIEQLTRRHIDTVFGYPGGCIMPLYDALVDSPVTHILCRHEQACALAAQGYSRASGRLGVCIATSGPGATNLITGVADAHRDSVPLLVITGQVARPLIGTDAFQETDVLGMTLGIVKHSYLIRDAGQLPAILEEAMDLALSGRPGPVWIDIPKDVLLSEIGTPPAAPLPAIESPALDETALGRAVALLKGAHRPLLYSGGGVALAGAEQALRRFAAITGMPQITSLKGIGNPGRDAELDLGMLGMHGSPAANLALEETDLLVVVGARLDDRATGNLKRFAPKAALIHIDTDAAELGKLRAADVALKGALAPYLESLARPLSIAPWQRQCHALLRDHGLRTSPHADPEQSITGENFMAHLSQLTDTDTLISCDVGQHQMWVAQHYHFDHPRQHLTSGGLGTMGFGLPAAIGAMLARPEATVINVSGDGSFMMNAQELATVRRYGLPLKLIILDNQCLGMVRQQQELFFNDRESEIDLSDNPDFLALARVFDIPGLSIRGAHQIRRGIETLLAYPGPMLLHVAISRQDNVWPTVRPGGANSDMLQRPQTSTSPKENAA